MRLNRFLAATGITSRRGADELIAAGRVTVNGKPCTDFHFQPGPTDHVKVDGKLIHQRAPVHILLNKPRGFVCTRRDPHAPDTIYHLLPSKFSSLAYVGRLDAQSEGLLLLTNDGELTQRLTHPHFKIEKEYEVVLDRASILDLAQRLGRAGRETVQRHFDVAENVGQLAQIFGREVPALLAPEEGVEPARPPQHTAYRNCAPAHRWQNLMGRDDAALA